MRNLAMQTPVTFDANLFERSIVGFSETVSHYLVKFEMPEFLGDDVTVEVTNDELIVRGRDRHKNAGGPRAVSLRLETEQSGVLARFRDGILVVALPKKASALLEAMAEVL